MTERIAPACPTLVESPDDPTASLVCFLGEGHEGEWHYDSRGLGASFRIGGNLGEEVTVRFGVGPQQADAPTAPNLPVPIGGPDGQLDADALRALAPILRRDLIASLRYAATTIRQARGTVVVPEDTYDLVRRVVSAGESLRSVAEAFSAAAVEADAIAGEEALSVSGAELDGMLLASLFVPDGAGQRIAVRADYASGSSVWDVDSLIAWVAEQTVADEGRKPPAAMLAPGEEPEEVPVWTNAEAVSLVRDGIDRLLALGKFSPAAREVEQLRKRLAEQQRDADAAVIRQVRSVGPRTYRGVRVTREEAK